MSDDKPTCVVRRNYLNPVRRYCETHDQMFDGECPGPVIATKKCKCGNVKPHGAHSWQSGFRPDGGPIVTGFGIATEPETPVFGETCKNCHEPIYRDGVYRHCDDDKVDCTLMAEPAFDPTPELRDRIARVVCDARMKCGWPNNERLPRGFIDATDDQIADAILEKFVLSALGEPRLIDNGKSAT